MCICFHTVFEPWNARESVRVVVCISLQTLTLLCHHTGSVSLCCAHSPCRDASRSLSLLRSLERAPCDTCYAVRTSIDTVKYMNDLTHNHNHTVCHARLCRTSVFRLIVCQAMHIYTCVRRIAHSAPIAFISTSCVCSFIFFFSFFLCLSLSHSPCDERAFFLTQLIRVNVNCCFCICSVSDLRCLSFASIWNPLVLIPFWRLLIVYDNRWLWLIWRNGNCWQTIDNGKKIYSFSHGYHTIGGERR